MRLLAGIGAEIVLSGLPIVVVIFVFFDLGKSHEITSSTEWAFAAAMLFGQSLTRFVSGLVRGKNAAAGPAGLAIALVVVLGLVPSLFLLFTIMMKSHSGLTVPGWQQSLQIALFLLSIVAFLSLSLIGDLLASEGRGT